MNVSRILPEVTRIDGDARYRVDGAGTRAVLIPAICRLKKHRLDTVGYRVTEAGGILRVGCDCCAAAGTPESSWIFRSMGPIATIAEIDSSSTELA